MSHKPYLSNKPKNGKKRLTLKQLRRYPQYSYINKALYNFNMNLCETLYNSGNPLYAWEAIKRTITAGKVLPHWVLLYLSETADTLLSHRNTNPRDIASELKLTKSNMRSYKDFDDDLTFYYYVEELIEQGNTLEDSLDMAKRKFKINRGVEALKKNFYDTQKIVKCLYGQSI